jgi:hemoglobin
MAAQQPQPNLYERLGGVYSIACVVDDLIDRIMVDPRLNANPRVDEAHHKIPPPRLQVLVNRNGVLGRRWPATIYRALDG